MKIFTRVGVVLTPQEAGSVKAALDHLPALFSRRMGEKS